MSKPHNPDQVAIVIPARMASTRLPGKPLKEFRGKPLLQWAVEAARGAAIAEMVMVATDSFETAKWCLDHGVSCWRGEQPYATGSDRVAGLIQRIGDHNLKIVINLQCDEPEITAADLDRMILFMQTHRTHQVVTFRCPWLDDTDRRMDRECVKVIVDRNHNAIYFSRAGIPGGQHVGVYGFRMAALRQFAQLPQSHLEQCEGLEQLRLIERGTPIHVLDLDRHVRSVNTPEDIEH